MQHKDTCTIRFLHCFPQGLGIPSCKVTWAICHLTLSSQHSSRSVLSNTDKKLHYFFFFFFYVTDRIQNTHILFCVFLVFHWFAFTKQTAERCMRRFWNIPSFEIFLLSKYCFMVVYLKNDLHVSSYLLVSVMLFIFRTGEECKEERARWDGAEMVASGSSRWPSISSGYQGLLQNRNKESEVQPSWRIVLKYRKVDSCTAERHSSPGVREELLKSRQELLSLLCHSWVTPVKCWFANLKLGKLAEVFAVKYLQTRRAQHINKCQIKPCRVHRGSFLSFALIFTDETVPC